MSNFNSKVAQIFVYFLAYFEKYHFEVNNAVVTFWASLEKHWSSFYSSSDRANPLIISMVEIRPDFEFLRSN